MRWQAQETKPKKPYLWRPWFAWYPVETLSNVWVWLERVERIDYMAGSIPVNAPFSGIFRLWSYRVAT